MPPESLGMYRIFPERVRHLQVIDSIGTIGLIADRSPILQRMKALLDSMAPELSNVP